MQKKISRSELIESMAQAIAIKEGFRVTAEQARANKMRFPTRAQRNANPGNIRRWRDKQNQPYPTADGYVDFVTWAGGNYDRGIAEGWRVLGVLLGQYIDGRYTPGIPRPSLRQIFAVYAPAEDSNDPEGYAQFVARRLGIDPDTPVLDVIG